MGDAKNRRLEKEKESRKKLAIAASAERRKNQLSAWVVEHGTDNQKKRFKEGFLPEDEIVYAIRDQAFAPLADEPRYEKLTKGDVCDSDEDWHHDVGFNVYDADKLSAEEFDKLESLRGIMPEATITPRMHIGECDECETRVRRVSFKVTMVVGELTLTREYGM
ncbi:MAG: hypothetical protein WA151_14700 [Desulfatirhabdiaceae bacterium]